MSWDKLSMADRAKFIQLGVSQGITDLGIIRDTYNQYAQGGDMGTPNIEDTQVEETKEERGFFGKLADTFKAGLFLGTHTPKDWAYTVMAGDDPNYPTSGVDRSGSQIFSNLARGSEILDQRKHRNDEPGIRGRDLASLYIYGNDLGEFKEAGKSLQSKGVDYSKYLQKRGINPKEVVTYEGRFPHQRNMLPIDVTNEQLVDYVNSPDNRNYGNMAADPARYHASHDDVGGFLERLDIDDNGQVKVYSSDLFDFDPVEYAAKYSNMDGHKRNIEKLYLEAKALDMVGTPFILKQEDDIPRVDYDVFWDNYYDLPELSREVSHSLGYLPPEVVIYGKGPSKQKTLGGKVNRSNKK